MDRRTSWATVHGVTRLTRLTVFIHMGATRDYPTKCSNSESQRQTPYDITYMWNRKYGINEHIHQTETDSQM